VKTDLSTSLHRNLLKALVPSALLLKGGEGSGPHPGKGQSEAADRAWDTIGRKGEEEGAGKKRSASPDEPKGKQKDSGKAGMSSAEARAWMDANLSDTTTKAGKRAADRAHDWMVDKIAKIRTWTPPKKLRGTWSAAANGTVEALGRHAIEDTKRTGREHSFMVDAETGEVIGPYLLGAKDSVVASEQLVKMKWSRTYIHAHTHPVGLPFSPEDIGLFFSFPQLTKVVVFDAEGNTYEMKKPQNFHIYGYKGGLPDVKVFNIEGVIDICRGGMALAAREQGIRDGMPEAERLKRWGEAQHEWWKVFAEKMDLTYRRIKMDKAEREAARQARLEELRAAWRSAKGDPAERARIEALAAKV
jgi:hypothetical protein